jgi:hypothetical protein
MMRILPAAGGKKLAKTSVGLGLAAALAGCAGTKLPPQAPPAPVAAQMTLGRIVAIRQVSVADGQGAAGLNAVLGALNEGGVDGPVSGREIVIRQDNGNTVALTFNMPGFAVGDEVGIITSDPTTLIHR